jgi:hypothetical protein
MELKNSYVGDPWATQVLTDVAQARSLSKEVTVHECIIRYKGRIYVGTVDDWRGKIMFSAVPRASGLVFMFCAPEHVFGDTEGVGSRFHVLHARTCFRRNRGCLVTFSCFDLTDSFSAVRRVPSVVFMFYAPELIFCGTEGIGSRFLGLLSRARFRRYRGRRVSIS